MAVPASSLQPIGSENARGISCFCAMPTCHDAVPACACGGLPTDHMQEMTADDEKTKRKEDDEEEEYEQHLHIHIYTHIHIYVYIRTYMYIYIYVYMYGTPPPVPHLPCHLLALRCALCFLGL